MSRPTRHRLNLLICKLISKRGSCQRLQVGCLITQNKRIVSSGYNGPLLGTECSPDGCDFSSKCKHSVHAEANAIAAASRGGVALKDATIYCTHAPCYECAKYIIQAGITSVIYAEEYGDGLGLQLLKDCPHMQVAKIDLTTEPLYDQIENYQF